MYYVSEHSVQRVIKQADITSVIEEMFIAVAEGGAKNFPVVREELGHRDAIFGFKSGFDRSGPTLGVKAGGLWPGNIQQGIPNHQSTIMLFDPETGGPFALVRGTYLTALRTAAASALSIRALAKSNATRLGIIGAGGQARFQLDAALKERDFSHIQIYDPNTGAANSLADKLQADGNDAKATDVRSLVETSDVVITITPSRESIVRSEWVQPGTHFACMGADTRGKKELDPNILRNASIFGDDVEQAISIGECQHAYGLGLIEKTDITLLGHLLKKNGPGRTTEEEITIFDSTGIGLQDLAAARLTLKTAIDKDVAQKLES